MILLRRPYICSRAFCCTEAVLGEPSVEEDAGRCLDLIANLLALGPSCDIFSSFAEVPEVVFLLFASWVEDVEVLTRC